ncbi:IS30 family transposase [Mycoplasma sp. CSL10166]|nr:IS30 family transposase [Mycoplasma sp. CSL10166]
MKWLKKKDFLYKIVFKITFHSIQNNFSLRSIARSLRRNVSSISREIRKNCDYYGNYNFLIAEEKMLRRKSHKYLFRFDVNFKFEEFSNYFKKKYDKKFHGVKATYNYVKSKNNNILIPSIKTIFNWLKTNKWIITRKDRLRSYYKKGGKRQSSVISRLIKSAEYVLPIWARPKEVDLRLVFGHWEADLILGKRSTGYKNIITLTERKTRIGFADFVSSKSPNEINAKLKQMIIKNKLNVKSITIDNGIEFEKIGILAKWLNIKIYRAEPYASFQRGSNENWNGLIRREFKKGFDFNSINFDYLQEIVFKINNMPREILKWKTSLEMFTFENLT